MQVVEACLATRPNNGGLVDLAALCKLVQVTPLPVSPVCEGSGL